MPKRPAARTALATQLRLLRLRCGLSQEALAEKAGVSVATIGAIEEGQRQRPYPNTLRALANSLELSAEDRAAFLSLSASASETTEDDLSMPPRAALPVPPTPLIGREGEVAAAQALLVSHSETSAVRLLTLVGPGGVGKTRLAIEIVRTIQSNYADGAAFVDLAPVRDQQLVPATIAHELGVREAGGRSAWELVLLHLRARHVLLVLDNFEHLPGAAPLLTEIVGACPGVALLVTSRTALRLRGEHRMPIGPLATPAADQPPPAADAASYAAIRLFADRLREVMPGFSIDDSNVTTVAEICRRLDGIPLALELAAARAQVLSPAALLRRLDSRLHLLSSGPVDLPERQRTLRNTLAWSYDLLDAKDQVLLRRLAVFAGGWTIDAATVVCADTDLPATDVLDRLGVLIDSSLIQVRRVNAVGSEPRFGMHEMIREYALERLEEAAEEPQIRDRHLELCLALAEAARPHLDGPGQVQWMQLLEQDHDNFRAALTWSAQGAAPLLGVRLATALLSFWFMRGHLREGSDRLQTALAAPDTVADAATLGRGLAALGFLLAVQGQFAEARIRLESALTISRAINESVVAAFALRSLGFLASVGADYESAGGFLNESLAIARGSGSLIDVAMALIFLGDVTLRRDLDRARELFQESSAILSQLQNYMLLAVPLRRLGMLAHLRGDIPLAVRLCVESLTHNRNGGERLGVAAALVALAPIVDSQGQPECAVQLLSKADALASSIGGQLLPFEAEQFDTAVARLRERLGPAAWGRAWDEGRQLPLDEAVRSVERLAAHALR